MTATVLIVDDISTNVKLLEARLANKNFNVLAAYNGADALTICMQKNIDLVLSDVMMPQIDGFELCAQLKSNCKTKNIPVILLTGLDEDNHKAHALNIGADDFLTKPINEVTLLTRVKNLLIQKKLKDDIASVERVIAGVGENYEDVATPLSSVNLKAEGRILLLDVCGGIVSKVLPILSEAHNVFVENAPEALRTLNEHRFDILLIHVCEAGVDSLQFCSAVRANRKTAQLPILLITEADNEILTSGLHLGANDYVLNPINRFDLMARLNVQLSNKRLADYLEFNLKART